MEPETITGVVTTWATRNDDVWLPSGCDPHSRVPTSSSREVSLRTSAIPRRGARYRRSKQARHSMFAIMGPVGRFQ